MIVFSCSSHHPKQTTTQHASRPTDRFKSLIIVEIIIVAIGIILHDKLFVIMVCNVGKCMEVSGWRDIVLG